MSYIVPPTGDLAGIGDLAVRRRIGARPLPAEVVEQIHVAAQLADELEEAGVELRFDTGGAGRVRAVLCDRSGGYLGDVSLADVVELEIPF